jgi:hypothetical protein
MAFSKFVANFYDLQTKYEIVLGKLHVFRAYTEKSDDQWKVRKTSNVSESFFYVEIHLLCGNNSCFLIICSCKIQVQNRFLHNTCLDLTFYLRPSHKSSQVIFKNTRVKSSLTWIDVPIPDWDQGWNFELQHYIFLRDFLWSMIWFRNTIIYWLAIT